jgi:hypothetical protein
MSAQILHSTKGKSHSFRGRKTAKDHPSRVQTAEKARNLPMAGIVFILSKSREAHTPSVLFGAA